MASTANIESLLAANEKYAASLSPSEKSLPLPPAKKYAIVTCMDARLHPSAAFGIALGDAHIIRNAGGSAREALRSLIISQTLLGTEEILVVKHSDCGMVTFSGEELFETLGGESREVVKGWLEFKEVREAVKEDVDFLKGSKLLKGTVSGWVYKVESGEVERVV